MPATYVGATAPSNLGSGGSVTWTYPSGTQAGDLVILQFSLNGGINNAPSVSGWAALNALQSYNSNIAYTSGFMLFWKVVTSTDLASNPQTSAFSTYNSNDFKQYISYAWRGASISVPSATSLPGLSQFGNVGAGSAVLPSVAGPIKPGSQLLVFGAGQGDNQRPATYTSDANTSANGSYPGTNAWRRTALTSGTGNQGGEAYATGTGFSALMVVATNAAPGAPTPGGTDGATVDRTAAVPLTWTHVDADGDAQVGYDIQYRALGSTGAFTSLVSAPTGGATASYSVPANTFGGKVQFRVRTYDAAGPGDWSALFSRNFQDPSVGTASTAPSKVDPLAALALHAALSSTKKVQGSYAGDNTTNRTIAVGFTPDLVLVSGPSAFALLHGVADATGVGGGSVQQAANPANATLTASGFSTGNGTGVNITGNTYSYTAFKFSI